MRIKRESPNFAAWDAHGMASHLEAMEARGWRFRSTDWLGRWEYEPCEPRAVRYAIAYAPSRRNWRITPTPSERDLEDICFDAGWRKQAALSRFHIYRNPDPNATDLETDEAVRLDTLERSLNGPIRFQALLWTLWSLLVLGVLIWALQDNLPRALAAPSLPGAMLFCIWLMLAELVPWCMYLNWRKDARFAAEGGLPCPEVTGWKQFTRINRCAMVLILLWLLSAGSLLLLLAYTAIFLIFYAVRWYLTNRMLDEALAENLWQVALIAAVILLFSLNRLHVHLTAGSPAVETMPLMAQDLLDTSGMDLYQYDLNNNDGPLASYHDYWQPDNNSSFDIRYTVFDLRVPLFRDICRDWFREDFVGIASRTETTPEPADPAPWGAEAAACSTEPGRDRWLIFYDTRIVFLSTSWNMTDSQIAVAAEKLAP